MITSRVSMRQAKTLTNRRLRSYSATGGPMNGNVFVFRPGGIQWSNVFTDWALLISAMSCVQGRKILEFDDSVATPCEIPAGTWPMKDVMWAGFGPRPGVWRTVVAIQSGAEFTDLRMI